MADITFLVPKLKINTKKESPYYALKKALASKINIITFPEIINNKFHNNYFKFIANTKSKTINFENSKSKTTSFDDIYKQQRAWYYTNLFIMLGFVLFIIPGAVLLYKRNIKEEYDKQKNSKLVKNKLNKLSNLKENLLFNHTRKTENALKLKKNREKKFEQEKTKIEKGTFTDFELETTEKSNQQYYYIESTYLNEQENKLMGFFLNLTEKSLSVYENNNTNLYTNVLTSAAAFKMFVPPYLLQKLIEHIKAKAPEKHKKPLLEIIEKKCNKKGLNVFYSKVDIDIDFFKLDNYDTNATWRKRKRKQPSNASGQGSMPGLIAAIRTPNKYSY